MNRSASRHMSLFWVVEMLVIASSALGEPSGRNEVAIREVIDGTRQQADADWWGYCPDESTTALQSAIDSGAKKVIVRKMPGPWIVDQIQLADDQELFFEPGVVVQAKRGAFRGRSDSLFTAWNRTNVTLTGYGATLRMHRDDYDGPDYEKAEWRHVLSFRGCTNVTVQGLTLMESGGDGIYLGAGRHRETNRNVIIRDVVCDRNYRQGISVITAENLLIENCVLKNTAGTAPAAGIDFEPNHAWERLVNCVMRNCVIEDNQGLGIHLYLRPLNGSSEPVSIRIENCVTRGSNSTSASIITSCGPEGPVQGLIELVNCRFQDHGRAGIRIGSKPPSGLKLRFIDCVISDASDQPALSAPISFSTRAGDLQPTGGVHFQNLTVRDPRKRPLMAFRDAIGSNLEEITGTVTVHRGDQTTEYRLDPETIARWVPFDPVLEIPIVDWQDLPLQPVVSGPDDAKETLPHHRQRNTASYLLQASEGDQVRLRLRHQAVGRATEGMMSVHAISPTGQSFEPIEIRLGEQGQYDFTADATGVFVVRCQPGRHTVQILESSHPICMAGDEGRIHLVSTTGEFIFWVPGDVQRFGVRAQGEGDGERLTLTLLDDQGQVRWQQANIGYPESFTVQRQPTQEGQVWRLKIDRPEIGVLEDIHLMLRGVPALLGFEPRGLLGGTP
ncbi:MAG: hypothetical protein EA424_14095 [Planctomycetaceae bacterium]|nr:MAG: hypothetical protein EA424_14095 [Planctomycetaceae bacterium]